MKVIFIKDLKNQGKKGDIKEVKDGYAKNYLIKAGYAVPQTEYSKKRLENELEEKSKEERINKDKNLKLKENLEKIKIKFKVKTGIEDKVFGSISAKQISTELKNLGYEIDKKKIHSENISSIGFHNVKIDLYKDIEANIKIELEKEV